MFDPHRQNRRYSRKTQRRGQIIRSRLIDPPMTIDLNKIEMYRAFLDRNPAFGSQGPPLPAPPQPPIPPYPDPVPPIPIPPEPEPEPWPDPQPPDPQPPGPQPPDPQPPDPQPPDPQPPDPEPPDPEPPEPSPSQNLPYHLHSISFIDLSNGLSLYSCMSDELYSWESMQLQYDPDSEQFYFQQRLEPFDGFLFDIYFFHSDNLNAFIYFSPNALSNIPIEHLVFNYIISWPHQFSQQNPPQLFHHRLSVSTSTMPVPLMLLTCSDSLTPGSTRLLDFSYITPTRVNDIPNGLQPNQGVFPPLVTFPTSILSIE